MIEIGKHPEFNTIYGNPGVSKYEVWYNDINAMDKRHKLIKYRRYILPTIGFLLLTLIPIPAGVGAIYIGILNKAGNMIVWGAIILGIGFLELKDYKVYINMVDHLYKDGVGVAISRWAYKERKKLMKKLRKRYWFIYISFSCIDHIDCKKINSEISRCFIYTKDGKIWPHNIHGIAYNRKMKGDREFINEIFEQYEKWKSEHGEG